MVSSLERFVFSRRISGVMNGLFGLELQDIVLRGACLSRRLDSVEEKRVEYDCRSEGGSV